MDREQILFEIEDYIGGNVECQCAQIDRMALTVFLRAKLDAVRNAALDEAKAVAAEIARTNTRAVDVKIELAIDKLKEPQP